MIVSIMDIIVTDLTAARSVCLSVRLSVCQLVHTAKAVRQNVMLFGRTLMWPQFIVLDRWSIPLDGVFSGSEPR